MCVQTDLLIDHSACAVLLQHWFCLFVSQILSFDFSDLRTVLSSVPNADYRESSTFADHLTVLENLMSIVFRGRMNLICLRFFSPPNFQTRNATSLVSSLKSYWLMNISLHRAQEDFDKILLSGSNSHSLRELGRLPVFRIVCWFVI